MNKTKRITGGIICLFLFLTLILTSVTPIISYADAEIIYIESAEDFKDFAKNCAYDSWSRNKSFVLTKNISLSGIEFEPIPSFGGSFDGSGHVISGFSLDGAYSPCGLFSKLESGGVIKNLTVNGAISPEGDRGIVGGIVGDNSGMIENCLFIGTVIGEENVGGIAGVNRAGGSITGCTVSGEIIGESRAGGIAGSNAGLISSCLNAAKVNTVVITPAIPLDKINVSLTLDITKLPSLNSLVMTDAGGIAGYSSGIIIGCTNKGNVGYPHVGYNVGGIVGRSQGHLSGNLNGGEILGRKDVGGIVGHIEPFVNYKLSEDLLASLKKELDALNLAISDAAGKADGGISSSSKTIDSIIGHLGDASDSVNTLIGNVTDYGDGLVDEVNRLGLVLGETLTQLSGVASSLPSFAGALANGLIEIEEALDGLDELVSIGADAIGDIMLAADDASAAFGKINEAIQNLEAGAEALNGALTLEDEEGAKTALKTIRDGLYGIVDSADALTSSLEDTANVLSGAVWVDSAIEQIDSLISFIDDASTSAGNLYEVIGEIEENITVYWPKLVNSGDALSESIGYFADALAEIGGAMELADSAIDKIGSGIRGLIESISIKDETVAEQSLSQISGGMRELITALEKGNETSKEISNKLENLVFPEEIDLIVSESFNALGDIIRTGGDASSAAIDILSAVYDFVNNVSIDFDSVEEGGSLVIDGGKELRASFDQIRSAINSASLGMKSLETAINEARGAILVNDEEKLRQAFEKAYSAIGDIISAIENATEVLSESEDTLKEAKLWSDELIFSLSAVAEDLSGITGGMVRVRDGVDQLIGSLKFDGNLKEDGLDLIGDGFSDMAEAAEAIKNTFIHIKDSLCHIEAASEDIEGIVIKLTNGIAYFADAAEVLTDIMGDSGKIILYLAGVDTITLEKPSESITATANRLFASISMIETDLNKLNAEITNVTDDVLGAIINVNEIFERISEEIIDIIYSLDDEIIIDDISEKEINSITNGKIFSCINNGNVEGDINVGGIGGAMGLEYALDPEDDLSPALSVTQKKQYQLKAVIHACENTGVISSKYDSAGGIIGKMDLGLIYQCEAYGSIDSIFGNYVGGIAGISAGIISESFAKCLLSGGKYVGGIVGVGVDEDYFGDSSLVKNCYSMVEVLKASQFSGAVSGAKIGEYENNCFISDSLAGIDRVSYQGKADPISYDELTRKSGIPADFLSFTLKFVADGKLIYSESFKYGESFDDSVFPDIPEKSGHYGVWDKTELSNLIFDTTVNVVYTPYTTTVGSEEKREDGRDIFLVEGEFRDNDRIIVTEGADTEGLQLEVKLFTKDTLVESWTLTIPKDGLDSNNVHFLPENQHCRIYVKIDGEWRIGEIEALGSYLTFDAPEETIEIVVAEHTVKIMPIVIIAVLLVGAIIATVIILYRKKKAKAPAAVENEKEELLIEAK